MIQLKIVFATLPTWFHNPIYDSAEATRFCPLSFSFKSRKACKVEPQENKTWIEDAVYCLPQWQ